MAYSRHCFILLYIHKTIYLGEKPYEVGMFFYSWFSYVETEAVKG